MVKPIVSFICWNRAGLNARNLTALLKTTDDFDLYIVDSNSIDDTWKFIERLKDSRIKEIKKLDLNRGCAYAINYILSKRKKEQFFFHLDSDTCIETRNWIAKFMEVMNTYPNIGAASTISTGILRYYCRFANHLKVNGVEAEECDAMLGNCLCMRPELIESLGYFNEETGRCDSDYSFRISKYTNYKMALVKSVIINQKQSIKCENCIMQDICTVREKNTTCFKIRDSKYQNQIYEQKTQDLLYSYYKEIEDGVRTPYCASIHDKESIDKYYYNKSRAEKTFKYYIDNAN